MFVFVRRVYFALTRRWRRFLYKRLFGQMGAGCSVCAGVIATNTRDIHLGKKVKINDRVILQACEGAQIKLEDDVVISFGSMLITGGLKLDDSGVDLQKHSSQDICIGKGTWIGAGVTILPGVTIGENSIVGAGSIVTGDVPANCLALGAPAKVVRQHG